MICSILLFINLLFISLTFCVCETFVVNVTQTSYQAEQDDNITLEWMFTVKRERPLTSLSIFCELITADHTVSVLYHLHEGVEIPKSQDGRFAGRVLSDKDVLREGRLRLHMSRLRADDSGLYLCEVSTNYGGNFGECRLNVTAAAAGTKPQTPTLRPQPESWMFLYIGLAAAAAAVFLVAFIAGLTTGVCVKCTKKKGNISAARKMLSYSEEQPIKHMI